jgi:hypothetical protein
VKCFAKIKQSKTDPDFTVVATMLNMAPITADPIGDRDCACGDGFLFFASLSASAVPVGSGLST